MISPNEFIIDKDLPEKLQTRLKLIIQSVPRFWEQGPYRHFTNHSSSHSERVHHQKLAQLAQELPESRRLTKDEVFIVSAAAWLYETGMQSPNLKPVLGFDCRPGDTLPITQTLKIREKKHLLTERLIIDSVRRDYQGPPLHLGLNSPADDYTQLTAEVCRWCSDEPLEKVPEKSPVNGLPVRVRLLVALLRLADQLYIDSSRVNLDWLQQAKLPMSQFAKWWAYQYVQTLPIVNGQFRFHYFIPASQKEYLGHIRALIEPDFEFDNNPTVRYLWNEHQLRLIPNRTPSVRLDQQVGFQREMSRDLLMYLRDKIPPVDTPTEVFVEPDEIPEERCLLVLDYENLVLQLGREGYFFNNEALSRLLVDLLIEAGEQNLGPVEGLAIGHWDRPDLIEVAQMLKARVYELLTVETQEDVSRTIEQALTKKLQGLAAPKQVILVAPREELAPVVQQFTNNRQSVNAWIGDLPDADIYRAVVRNHKFLHDLLQLRDGEKMDDNTLETNITATILHLDDALVRNKSGVTLEELPTLLNQLESLYGRSDWWRMWLINQNILVLNHDRKQWFVDLSPENPDVTKVRNMRTDLIKSLQALSTNDESVPQSHLVAELKSASYFQNQETVVKFLELLKQKVVIRAPAGISSETEWFLKPFHWAVVALDEDSYIPQFALALDHVLIREGYPYVYEHTLDKHFSRYFTDDVFQTIYELALSRGWVERWISNRKHRRSGDNIVHVSFSEEHSGVGKTLRDRDILLNILNHRSAHQGLKENELWQKLTGIQAFKLDNKSEFKQWLKLLECDDIIIIETDDSGPGQDVITINRDTALTQLLLGRMNVHGLVKNIRLIGATRPDRKKPTQKLLEQLTRFVTNHKKDLAGWTVDYAAGIKLVTLDDDSIYLNQHSLVRQLDRRERATCEALVELMNDLVRQYRDGWVPRFLVVQAMEKDDCFGYSRGEHEYWLDQAIYRLRLLREKRERGKGGRLDFFVSLPEKKK
ncbi:MAG: hypothetical protein KDJ97_26195 [Anaerolineae bacterium]|nr:hypothetical protein [Anaerolineae bacterium]